MQGIVIENISNLYKIKAGGAVYSSAARGKFKQEGVTPLVGDIVEFEVLEDKKEIEAIINEIKPRIAELKRPKIANIEQIIFIISTKNPKPDLRMLDKQLAYAEYLKIKPIIVVNKIDLSDIYKKIVDIYTKTGYKVIATNAKENKGVEELKKELKGKISAFSGNSGVGKSTTINALFNTDVTLEGEISKKNKKGKNTTTQVKLYELDENTYIADTPGFANFELNEIDYSDLDEYFIDIAPFVQNCEFVGCTHIKEEKCGVKHAVEEGKIARERYDNFCKIYTELKESDVFWDGAKKHHQKEERKW